MSSSKSHSRGIPVFEKSDDTLLDLLEIDPLNLSFLRRARKRCADSAIQSALTRGLQYYIKDSKCGPLEQANARVYADVLKQQGIGPYIKLLRLAKKPEEE